MGGTAGTVQIRSVLGGEGGGRGGCVLLKTSSATLGRPRSPEPAVILTLVDIVSRVSSRIVFSSGAWYAAQSVTVHDAKCQEAVQNWDGRLLVRILWLWHLGNRPEVLLREARDKRLASVDPLPRCHRRLGPCRRRDRVDRGAELRRHTAAVMKLWKARQNTCSRPRPRPPINL